MRNSYPVESIKKSERITRLVAHLYAKLPEIESARALLLTESYQQGVCSYFRSYSDHYPG